MGKTSEAGWREWDKHEVGRWMKERDLGKYAPIFVENEITGRQLSDCLEVEMLAGIEKYTGWKPSELS